MHCPDIYLACGCAAGDQAALAAFDGNVLSPAVPVLHRMGFSASQIDEVVQVMRAKLLVAGEHGRRPQIASYAGRGALVGWVRTAARRTALSMRRNKDEQIGGAKEDRGLENVPLPADMELDYLKSRYQAEFKQAVEDAIATLGAEQLQILRLHYTDGLKHRPHRRAPERAPRHRRTLDPRLPMPCATRPDAACTSGWASAPGSSTASPNWSGASST
jgi:RNA polymerase sigma-70 factor (ECF subfamily)